jgi:hypothetical protein
MTSNEDLTQLDDPAFLAERARVRDELEHTPDQEVTPELRCFRRLDDEFLRRASLERENCRGHEDGGWLVAPWRSQPSTIFCLLCERKRFLLLSAGGAPGGRCARILTYYGPAPGVRGERRFPIVG